MSEFDTTPAPPPSPLPVPPPNGPVGPGGPLDGAGPGGERRWLVPLLSVIAVAAVGVLVLLIVLLVQDDDDDGDDVTATAPSTAVEATTTAPATTAAPTTTAAPATTAAPTTAAPSTTAAPTTTGASSTTAIPVEPDQPFEAIWPWSPSGVRFDDPVEAARSFATDFVGFEDPVVGVFQAGDSRSGEVEVRARDGGAVTTVFVRQLTPDDTWWVLGSATPNIVVTSPEALQEVDSPLALTGMARAFEGTVNVEVRVDGDVGPLATTFVTGSGGGDLGPFEGEATWTAPPAQPAGAVVFLTLNAEDGSVWEATVVRVLFPES